MRHSKWFLLSAAAAGVVSASAAQGDATDGPARSYLLVFQSGGALPAGLGGEVAACGGALTTALQQIGVCAATSSDPSFRDAVRRRIPGLQSVVPNLRVSAPAVEVSEAEPAAGDAVPEYLTPPDAAENDVLFDAQWNLAAIHAPEAWDSGVRGAGALVAVLDTGLYDAHPDLAGRVRADLAVSMVPGESWSVPAAGAGVFHHGTHVAGIIAAGDNGIGIIGVAPECQVFPVQVISRALGYGTIEWVTAGLIHAADAGADVVNMSLGNDTLQRRGYLDNNGTPSNPADDFWVSADEVSDLLVVWYRATSYAHGKGVTMVASAGNAAIDGDHDGSRLTTPSQLPHVISVSATAPKGWAFDQTTNPDLPTAYTNFGRSVVQFAAPGGGADLTIVPAPWTVGRVVGRTRAFDFVLSTNSGNLGIPGGRWAWASGTSMAAPHVAGVAALIVSKNGGSLHPDQVFAQLGRSADDLGVPGQDPYFGLGRVNAAKAVE